MGLPPDIASRDGAPEIEASGAARAPTGNEASPLTGEQVIALQEARQRRKCIDRAAALAAFGGWTTAALAVLCVPFALFSWEAAVMAAGLGVVAYHEFKGRRMLRVLNPAAPRVLGFNQVGFAALIVAYSVLQIIQATVGEGRYAEAIAAEPMLADVLEPIEGLMTTVTLAVYVTLIVGTIGLQGGAAWYYFSRRKHLRAYVEQTPGWVLRMQQVGALR